MCKINITDSAVLIGKVRLGDKCYIAQGSILRSKDDSLIISNNSFVLENSILIGTSKAPLKVGRKTVFGHKCIAIGAEIGDLCEIGNGVIIMPNAKIGNMCIFGEGTLIPEGMIIPDESVVVGRPGRVIRKLTEEDKNMIIKMRNNDITLTPYVENLIDNNPKEGVVVGKLYAYNDTYPVVGESSFLFSSAEITGDVKIGEKTIIASGVKIVGDSHGPIRIGNNVQILENTVLHLLPDNELIIEDNVIIGPGCIVHGSRIEEGTIVESGAIICDYSHLGKNTLVTSGSLVKQRSVFPANCILEGFPAKEIGQSKEPLELPSWAFNIEDIKK